MGDDDTEINALKLLGSDPDVRELASLERLRVIAAVAPRVRSLTEAQRAKKLRRESGAETTVGEVVDAQLARANIELDVLPLDGTTRRTLCTECGVIFVPHSKAKRTLCGQCLQPVCPCGSGLRGPKKCTEPSRVQQRHGAPWRCVRCR